MPESAADFDAMVEANISRRVEELNSTPAAEVAPAEPVTEPTSEAKPAEAATQTEPEPAKEPPSTPASQPTGLDQDAVFEQFAAELDKNGQDLFRKYRASGVSAKEALKQATAQASDAYWKLTNLESEKAKAAKETPAPPAETPKAAEPAVEAPEIQTLTSKMQALVAEYVGLEEHKKTFGESLAKLEARRDELDEFLLNDDAEFEQAKAARQELKLRKKQIRDTKAYLESGIPAKQRDLSDRYDLIEATKKIIESQQSAAKAREAEAQERQRAVDDQAVKAKEARDRGIYDAWLANLPVVMKEGDPVTDDLKADFEADAHTFIALKSPQSGGDIPSLLREFKTKWDARGDKFHRAKSAAYGKSKDKDVAVNAPEGTKAVAAPPKRAAFSEDDWDKAIDSKWSATA